MAGQMETAPNDGQIDVIRKVGVEDIWKVAVRENLFDFVFGRIGCHFVWVMALLGSEFVDRCSLAKVLSGRNLEYNGLFPERCAARALLLILQG